jgi:16S rRNA (cytidine1402-2'-O)-methyltransferase
MGKAMSSSMGKNSYHNRNRCFSGSNDETRPPIKNPLEPPEADGRGQAGTLYIVATPIGNLEDITIRAIRVLKEVRLIAAEDTRRTRILLDKYQISTPLTSLYDHNESKKSGLILAKLQQGDDVAYVSDAGTPGISDPGYILVKEAISQRIRVAPVPGASALVAALSVSGLPMDRFVFLGFLPAKSVRRRELLASLKQEERTLVFYESPRRLLAALHDFDELFGEREVVVSREMTKIYEEFLRGPAGELMTRLKDVQIRGEVTLIVAGCSGEAPEYTDAELLRYREQVRQEGGEGLSLRDVADRIAQETGASRRRIYRLLLFP